MSGLTETTLVGAQLARLPIFETLRTTGQEVLYLGLLAWLLMETRQLMVQGRCDYLTPVLRVAVGSALLASLPSIAANVEAGVVTWTASAMREANHGLWTDTIEHALANSLRVNFVDVFSLFSVRAVLGFGSGLLYLTMGLVKLMVIDVLWPIAMGLVLVFGAIAVPLGVWPGLGTLSGWVRNVIEVALWPVVFQVLVAMQVSAFSGVLQQVRRLDLQALFTTATAEGFGAGVDQMGGALGTLMQFWAMCLGYTLMTLFTPVLASLLVRSAPVSLLGGMAAAQMGRMTVQLVSILGSSVVGGMVTAGAAAKWAPGSSMGGTGASDGTRMGPPAPARSADRPSPSGGGPSQARSTVDERRYPAPTSPSARPTKGGGA